MITYRIKREQLNLELALLRAVYEQLETVRPDGLRYTTFQLDDEVSFVELVEGGGVGRLSQLSAFVAYRTNLEDRCEEPPTLVDLHQLGYYGFR